MNQPTANRRLIGPADIPARPWMTLAGDQAQVPPGVRAGDLLRLAAAVAEVTDPRLQPTLAEQDRLLLAMAAPNLPDDQARARLLDIVVELHQAEMADEADPVERRDPEYRSPEDYRESAAALARALVDADLKAVVPVAGEPDRCPRCRGVLVIAAAADREPDVIYCEASPEHYRRADPAPGLVSARNVPMAGVR